MNSIHRGADLAGGSTKPLRGLNRRSFLQGLGCASAALALSRTSLATRDRPAEALAVLVDTTRCEGCRMCEAACAGAHGLPMPDLDQEPSADRAPNTSSLAVIQQHVVDSPRVEDGAVFVKRQCMHCLSPACASACLTKALLKTREGPVIWREDKCMGCRYCMVSCPFNGPKFEYDSPTPRIVKCDFCPDRLAQSKPPACVASCPNDALSFGPRSQVLAEARRRIVGEPEAYVPHVFGEHEAGGLSWLYLAAAPFEQLGFPTRIGNTPLPEYTRSFLYGVPIVLTVVPALLLAINQATKQPAGGRAGEARDD